MKRFSSELEAAILFSRLPGIGAAEFLRQIQKWHLPSQALNNYLAQRPTELSLQSQKKTLAEELLGKTLEKLSSGLIFGCYCGQKEYPVSMLDLSEPPPVLFSTCNDLPVKMAAVIGSRRPDAEAEESVAQIVRVLGAAGYAILSGGATGIDSLAHQNALEFGIPTYAVLGCGVDVVYPARNARLFEQIKKDGGLVSELLCGAKPRRSFFPTRNRLIAALAEIVVIIQAGESSGSLITARWAGKLGRRLLVKKKSLPADFRWHGSDMLINEGAESFKNNFGL